MAEELKPAYLIVGTDGPKVARAIQRLRARMGEEGVELLSAREASGDDVVAACNALGLFGGGGRLVVVQDADAWKAADAKALAAYLEAPAPETVVARLRELRDKTGLTYSGTTDENGLYVVVARLGDETLGEPLAATKVFPPMVTRMIAIGEKTGALEKLLAKISEFYDAEVKAAVKALTSLIEQLMIGIMGLLVGGIVLAIFMPIIELQKKLGGGS